MTDKQCLIFQAVGVRPVGVRLHTAQNPLFGVSFSSGEWMLNPQADQVFYYLVQITKEISYIGKSIHRSIKVSTFCFVFHIHNIKQNLRNKIIFCTKEWKI